MTGPVGELELAKAVPTLPGTAHATVTRSWTASWADPSIMGLVVCRASGATPHPVATVAPGLLARGRDRPGEVLQHYSQLTAQGCAIPAGRAATFRKHPAVRRMAG